MQFTSTQQQQVQNVLQLVPLSLSLSLFLSRSFGLLCATPACPSRSLLPLSHPTLSSLCPLFLSSFRLLHMVTWLYGYVVYGYMVIWLYGYGYMVIWLYGIWGESCPTNLIPLLTY